MAAFERQLPVAAGVGLRGSMRWGDEPGRQYPSSFMTRTNFVTRSQVYQGRGRSGSWSPGPRRRCGMRNGGDLPFARSAAWCLVSYTALLLIADGPSSGVILDRMPSSPTPLVSWTYSGSWFVELTLC
jgi:hypothetical protein